MRRDRATIHGNAHCTTWWKVDATNLHRSTGNNITDRKMRLMKDQEPTKRGECGNKYSRDEASRTTPPLSRLLITVGAERAKTWNEPDISSLPGNFRRSPRGLCCRGRHLRHYKTSSTVSTTQSIIR